MSISAKAFPKACSGGCLIALPRRVQVLREADRPGGGQGVDVRRVGAVVIGPLVVDDVELAGVTGGRPRKDLRAARRRDEKRAAPGVAVIARERVVDMVVVRIDRV